MKAPAKQEQERELPPQGLTTGTCIKVIDLGTQEGKYKEQVKYNRQILVMFELPEHRIMIPQDDGTEKDMPMAVSKKYTLSFSKKSNLRKDMEQWYATKFDDKVIEERGGFDPSKILGRAAQIIITHNETPNATYANIEGLMPLAQGQPEPERENDLVLFDLDELDWDIWDGMSEGMQSWIGKSPEMTQALQERQGQHNQNASAPATPPPAEDYDDIPF